MHARFAGIRAGGPAPLPHPPSALPPRRLPPRRAQGRRRRTAGAPKKVPILTQVRMSEDLEEMCSATGSSAPARLTPSRMNTEPMCRPRL